MKKSVLALISIVMVLSMLLGCQTQPSVPAADAATTTGSPEATAAAEEASSEPVKLKFYAYGYQQLMNLPGYEDKTQNLGDVYNLLIDEFTAQHPNVSIELVTLNPAGGGTEQLDVDIASGTMPNIYYDSLLRVTKYNGLGYLLNLKDYVSADTINDYVAGSIDPEYVWNLPTDDGPMFLAVNKTLFEKIGALDLLPAEDSREWTTDEYLAALQAVKDAGIDNTYPTIFWAANQSGDAANFGFLFGFGAKFFEGTDYSKVVLNSAEGLNAFNFINNVVQSGLSVPGAAALNDDDMWATWQNQQISMTGGYSYLQVLAKESAEPFEAYFVNFPHAQGQPNPPFATDTHTLAVFKSENEQENIWAARFVEFITSSETWIPLICQAHGTLSMRNSFQDKLTLSPELAAIAKRMTQDGVLSYGPTCPKWSELRPLYASELQAMFSGAKTPEQALADFETEANAVLAD
mgnify:CR=1 FL=1